MSKVVWRSFVSLFIWLYQRTHGKFSGQVQGLRVLLLTTIGRRTGKKRITPLGYFEYEGCFVITASYGGSDHDPAWFYNLKSHPEVALQIGDQHLTVAAQIADAALRPQLWVKLVELAPGYGAYSKRTSREIPMILLRRAASPTPADGAGRP